MCAEQIRKYLTDVIAEADDRKLEEQYWLIMEEVAD